MKIETAQNTVSILEMGIGLIFIGLGSFSLLSNLKCPPESHDCVGWGIFGAAMFLVPGCLISAAGFLSYRSNWLPFGVIHAVLIGALVVYYMAGFALP